MVILKTFGCSACSIAESLFTRVDQTVQPIFEGINFADKKAICPVVFELRAESDIIVIITRLEIKQV